MIQRWTSVIAEKVLLVGFGITLGLIVSEVAFRIFSVSNHYINGSGIIVDIRKDQVNSKGLRDIEHSYEKPTDTYRIVGLGDSFMWGPYLQIEDLYMRKLEALLNGGGKLRFETINLAQPGGSPITYLKLYAAEGKNYHPDLVLIGIF